MADFECIGTFEIGLQPDLDEISVRIVGLDGRPIPDDRFKSISNAIDRACYPGVQPCLFARDMQDVEFKILVYEDDVDRWAQLERQLREELRACGLLPKIDNVDDTSP